MSYYGFDMGRGEMQMLQRGGLRRLSVVSFMRGRGRSKKYWGKGD